jgi:mercuric ion transport protein
MLVGMKQILAEKFGSVGAVLTALACPVCFPKLALIGSALGFGVLAPFEGYVAIGAQALFLVAFIGQLLAFRQHRNRWLLTLSALATLVLFTGYYIVPSTMLLLSALAGLVISSIWLIIEQRRCAECAVHS